jgi:cytochrome c oxidase assembly factor CtaG/polyferredoxin
MTTTLDAALRSWPWDPWLAAMLLVTGVIYFRGWLILRQREFGKLTADNELPATEWRQRVAGGVSPRISDPRDRQSPEGATQKWSYAQLGAFLAGLATIYLALASPIDLFAPLLLQIHMLQHLLLMMVVAPMIWFGAPMLPMLRGLPAPIRRTWIAPLLRSRTLQTLAARITHPLVALPLFIATTWLWHAPALYQAALNSPWVHYWQHVSFLAAALVFWYPVVRPYPARPKWSPWLLLAYLLLADVQNTVLSALFTFSDRIFYPHYEQVPRLAGISALDDQAVAGVLMWVPGSIAFLAPLFWIGFRLLLGSPRSHRLTAQNSRRPLVRSANSNKNNNSLDELPILQPTPANHSPTAFDLLRVPLLGRFLRWRHARLTLQIPLAILAILVIYDGLRGPQIGAMNLAGVLPWIHWRGLLVIALLAAGNLFCTACPFTLPRTLARKWLPEGRAWPRWLRGKWLAIGLLALFLWAYEAFSLWDSPWWTAWIAIGYFAAAFAVDAIFRGGAFCKYVCPLGQFNFVQSLISPLSVQVRSAAKCASCTTQDCIRGSAVSPGCQMQLVQPTKHSNMDCTFCLNCVHACPHDNVGILAVTPAVPLWNREAGSGIGRMFQRGDVAALVLLLTFGAFANAAGMVGPVVDWQTEIARRLGFESHWVASTIFYAIALIVAPITLVGVASVISSYSSNVKLKPSQLAMHFALAFVPIGFAMWLAHYSFHFFTSYESIVPVSQRFAHDLGVAALGAPEWSCACCTPVTDGLLIFELLALDVGVLLSLYAAWRIALHLANSRRQALRIALPWASLMVLLFVVGVWIVFQPMEMRGALTGGSG